jgi:hypothetical protein
MTMRGLGLDNPNMNGKIPPVIDDIRVIRGLTASFFYVGVLTTDITDRRMRRREYSQSNLSAILGVRGKNSSFLSFH